MKRSGTLICSILFFYSSVLHAQKADTSDTRYRPLLHFTPKANWMNDPNGMVYYKGTYHLFYQYYPNGNVWGPMHWGHATSTNLMNWKHGPIALIDEATGYQYHRAPDALQELISKLLRQSCSSWERRFHPDYYRALYRLFGWKYQGHDQNQPHRASVMKPFISG